MQPSAPKFLGQYYDVGLAILDNLRSSSPGASAMLRSRVQEVDTLTKSICNEMRHYAAARATFPQRKMDGG